MPHPELPTLVYEHVKLALESRHRGFATFALGIERPRTGPPVPGYEPLLIRVGCPDFKSRLTGCGIILW